MKGSYTQHIIRTMREKGSFLRKSSAVERAKDLHAEECERRLAQAMNNPKEKENGKVK